MSGEAETLYQQALNLAADERYQLAQRLLDTLAPGDLPEPPNFFGSEAEAEAAWREELNRRLDEVEQHPERLQSVEDAMAEIRAIRAAGRKP